MLLCLSTMGQRSQLAVVYLTPAIGRDYLSPLKNYFPNIFLKCPNESISIEESKLDLN